MASVAVVQPRDRWDADPLFAFTEGVRAALGTWDVLNMAIDGGWGDSAELEPEEQRAQMIEMIVDLFTMNDEPVDPMDVEDFLYNVMHENYSTEVEDGSLPVVSRLLSVLYVDCTRKKNFAGLQKLLDRFNDNGKWRPQVVRSGKGADDSSSDDDDEPRSASAAAGSSSSSAAAGAASSANEDEHMEDAPVAPAVDPDGWETVTSGRKKKGGKK